MTETVEFSRPVSVGSQVGGLTIEADPEERAALAKRFNLLGLDHLSADLDIQPDGEGLAVSGRISARVDQGCVITGDTVRQEIDEAVKLRFLPETDAPEAEELELEEDDCETLFFEGASVDLGEAVAQTMALALDPFPKSAAADAEAREAGILQEDEVVPDSPFAALQALKDEDSSQGA